MSEATPTRRCYLYWIHTDKMVDIAKEGYVGISYDPIKRFRIHKQNAKREDYKINGDFKRHLLSDKNLKLSVKVVGSREYISLLENKLRPKFRIGWNTIIGGDTGASLADTNRTHGLSGSKEYHAFFNLKYIHRDATLCDVWLNDGTGGIESFINWYSDQNPDLNHHVTLIDKLKPIGPDNILIGTRSEVLNAHREKFYSKVENMSLTLSGWSSISGQKPNTILYRMRRGWSVDEALGFKDHDGQYERRMDSINDPQKQMAICLLETTLKTPDRIAKECGFGSSLKRILHHHKLPKWLFREAEVTMDTGCWAIRVKRNKNITEFTDVVDLYNRCVEDGEVVNEAMVRETGYSRKVLTNFVEDLENAKIIR